MRIHVYIVLVEYLRFLIIKPSFPLVPEEQSGDDMFFAEKNLYDRIFQALWKPVPIFSCRLMPRKPRDSSC